jgi:hypothetical protein
MGAVRANCSNEGCVFVTFAVTRVKIPQEDDKAARVLKNRSGSLGAEILEAIQDKTAESATSLAHQLIGEEERER